MEKNDVDGRRAWIRSIFDKKISLLNSTHDLAPVMLAVHGTSLDVAWKICLNGFAAIPNISDAGWYGKGIYFSTYATYCLPYLKSGSPAIIVVCVMPGNPHPIIENKTDPNNFNGAALKHGCQSHYILTTKDGLIYPNMGEDYFDELVIEQESQVVPMYVVEINNANFGQLIRTLHASTAPPKTVSGIPADSVEKTEDSYYAIQDTGTRDTGNNKKYDVV